MKKKTDHYLLTLILALGLFLAGQTSFAQCELKFDYTVENCSKGQKDGKIYITLLEGSAPFTCKLYDMFSGKYEFIQSKEVKKISHANKILLFENLSSSSYRIQIIGAKCKVTLGGVDGIVINQKDK